MILGLGSSSRARDELAEEGGVDGDWWESDAESDPSGEESRAKEKQSQEPSGVATGELLRDESDVSSSSLRPVWMIRFMRFVCVQTINRRCHTFEGRVTYPAFGSVKPLRIHDFEAFDISHF
jgi:hypothetical protein